MLDQLICKAAAKSTTVSRYGGVLYTLKPDEKEGQFCGIFTYKNHVQISFANGAQLEDPENLLLGNGKYRRHINFESADEVKSKSLMPLIRQSSRMSVAE